MMQPITRIPNEFNEWMARVHSATPTEKGVFRLVNIRKTTPKTFEEQRIVVLVLDENGYPLPNIPVAFSYSTGPDPIPYVKWSPPTPPFRALVVPTQGGGQIDQIQGSAVKPGQPGGVTVYVALPDISSDAVSGAGMLQDHTGLHLTFQRQLNGVLPLTDRVAAAEARLAALEAAVAEYTAGAYGGNK